MNQEDGAIQVGLLQHYRLLVAVVVIPHTGLVTITIIWILELAIPI